HPYLYHLTSSAPVPFSGGVLRGANQEVFPILTGQFGSVYYAILKPNAIRNPHWHPIAWEFNYVISGRVRWTIVGPQNKHDSFEAKTGDLVFIPQGYFHYFENIDDKYDLVLLAIFNTSVIEPIDDISLGGTLGYLPLHVFAAIFSKNEDLFRNLFTNGTLDSFVPER
ncbi:unnamed protein product, partial [Didymodactylos carnosus]